ncbi:hypothetical protein O988_04395 [Pseudogymnoascus sp. VKM F-3808]|nr:hypothetical protein O988_04395 [Pseudogymnoascus sp. VKM F-3808]
MNVQQRKDLSVQVSARVRSKGWQLDIKWKLGAHPELTRRTSQNSNLSNLSNTPKKGFRRVFFNDFSAQEHTLNAPLTPSNPSFCLPLLGPASGISVASTETPLRLEEKKSCCFEIAVSDTAGRERSDAAPLTSKTSFRTRNPPTNSPPTIARDCDQALFPASLCQQHYSGHSTKFVKRLEALRPSPFYSHEADSLISNK